MTATANANEIHITRVYDAPVALVWEAFTDLNHVSKWWGPRGFTITTHSKELRAGGHWDYIMHGPDGTDWPNYARYHEVVPRKRLVYDHGAASADAKPLFHVIAEFSESNGKTTLDMRMQFDSDEAYQRARVTIKAANGNSTWDRLAEYLEKEETSKEIFVINRSFPVSRETMFDLWTKPDHFAKWLPPTGFTMQFKQADIREGGAGVYSMTNGQFTMYGRVDYLSVVKPESLRYVQCFTDADGNISRHPGAPVWPEKMLTNVHFASEGPNATRVTVRWEAYGDATAEEIAAFVAEKPGMTQGWTGSFDKLEAFIESDVSKN
ncbi:MAG: SRPBCC domain-containing protein [Gemmatimonas sp.]